MLKAKVMKFRKPFFTFMTISMSMVILMVTSVDASAQSTRERLTAIEKQLNALQRAVFTPGSRFQSGNNDNGGDVSTPAPTAVPAGGEGALIADINIRISELETQLRQLTGQFEEINFRMDSMNSKMETMEKDYEFRFREIEGGTGGNMGGGMSAPVSSGSVSVGAGGAVALSAPTVPSPAGTPKEKYDYAYGLVSNAQYEQAEVSFREFLAQHPDNELAGNAQYWLGQTFYARGNYTDATRTFLEGMSKYPESPKAPAYLLKVGMSLNLLGEKNEACEVYRELNARFPNSSENTRMRPAEERKAGCN